jgi:hypothetical protein
MPSVVLVELVAGGQRDQGLTQHMFMAAVHGLRAAPTGSLQRDLQLLTGESCQRRLLPSVGRDRAGLRLGGRRGRNQCLSSGQWPTGAPFIGRIPTKMLFSPAVTHVCMADRVPDRFAGRGITAWPSLVE